MIALLLNYLRRSWLIGVMACIAVAGFQVIANRVFIQINPDGADLSPLTRLIPQWVQSAFNVGPASMSDLNGFLAVCYQHPFLMVVLLAMPVALITGWLSGDVEKRTIALVLSRPVGRLQIVMAVAIVALTWCALAIACAWIGCLAGAQWTGHLEAINRPALFQATLNLAALIFAFTGIAATASAMITTTPSAESAWRSRMMGSVTSSPAFPDVSISWRRHCATARPTRSTRSGAARSGSSVAGTRATCSHGSNRLRHCAKMHGYMRGLRHHTPVSIKDRARCITAFADIRRNCAAL